MPSLSQIPLPVSHEQRVALQNEFRTGALYGASSRLQAILPYDALRMYPLLKTFSQPADVHVPGLRSRELPPQPGEALRFRGVAGLSLGISPAVCY